MIDAKKVRMMTKIAVYEQNSGKKDLKMHRCSRRVYIGMKRLEAFLALTLAYLLGAGMYSLRYLTEIMTEGFDFTYKPVIIHLAAGYVILCAVGFLITTKIYGGRYDQMLKNIKKYDRELGRLKKYMEEPAKQEAGCDYDEII